MLCEKNKNVSTFIKNELMNKLINKKKKETIDGNF